MQEQTSLREIIDTLNAMFRYIFRKWKVIFIVGIIGAVLGLTYSIYKKPTYTATLTFVLEDGEGMGGALGQYAGLASMVGIDLGGASGGGIFKGDNIIELYKSRSIIAKSLLGSFDDKDLLIDRYITFNNLRANWTMNPKLKNINFHVPADQFTVQHDSILTDAVKTINKKMLEVTKPDKKLNIIKVEVEAKDEGFAKKFTETLVKEVNGFYTDTKTKKSTENLRILQKQTDSVKSELRKAISGVASSNDAIPNANPARQILKVPGQNKQIDVKANTAILEELVKNLEISKVSSRNNRPLIQIIDAPVLPLAKNAMGKVLGVIIGGLLAGFLAVFAYCAKFVFKSLLE